MKKEIMNIINTENEETQYFRINNVSYLKRWTKDALGNKVDRLTLEFDAINNVNFSLYNGEIEARDYEGIIKECEKLTESFFATVAKKLNNNMRGGYRNITKTEK